MPEVFAFSPSFFNIRLRLGISTYDCPLHPNWMNFSAKHTFVSPCHLLKFWDKKPKATTKLTLTSHQRVLSTLLFGAGWGWISSILPTVARGMRVVTLLSCFPSKWYFKDHCFCCHDSAVKRYLFLRQT